MEIEGNVQRNVCVKNKRNKYFDEKRAKSAEKEIGVLR